MWQALSTAFARQDWESAEELVMQLRYLTTAGDAITHKL